MAFIDKFKNMVAYLFTPNGDSLVDDTADAIKTVAVAGTAVMGKVRLVTATGDEATDDTADAVKAKLSANSGVDIGDVDVLSIAAGDNNIGNVDIVTLPAANLGQRAMAASLSTVPASDIADATYIGDIKFGEALPSGTNAIGKLAANSGVDIGDVDVTSASFEATDDGAVTLGTQKIVPIGALADETSSDPVDEGDVGIPRMTLSRVLRVVPSTDTGVSIQQDDTDKLAVSLYGKSSAAGDLEVALTSAGEVRVAGDALFGAGDDETQNPIGFRTRTNADGYIFRVQETLYNTNGWDRRRGNIAGTLLASAARTADTNSADQTNHNSRGVKIWINVTAAADTPSVVFNVQEKDPVSGTYRTILASVAITGISFTTLVVYPGNSAAANAKADEPLPRTWRVNCDHADTDSITYSVGYSLIV